MVLLHTLMRMRSNISSLYSYNYRDKKYINFNAHSVIGSLEVGRRGEPSLEETEIIPNLHVHMQEIVAGIISEISYLFLTLSKLIQCFLNILGLSSKY